MAGEVTWETPPSDNDVKWEDAPSDDGVKWEERPGGAAQPQTAAALAPDQRIRIPALEGDPSDTVGQAAQRVFGATLNAFGQGWQTYQEGMRGAGSLSPEDAAKLDKMGVGPNSPNSVARATWMGVVVPSAAVLDVAVRAPGAMYAGAQAVATSLGVPRDVASLQDAFLGTPHAFPMPKLGDAIVAGGPGDALRNSLPVARDMGLIGRERAPGEVAPMQAVHGSPIARDVLVSADGKVLPPDATPEGDFYGVRLHGDHEGVTNVNDIPADDIEITHKNGVPVEKPRVMASDTGVPKDETISEPAGGRVATDKAGNIRMDLLDSPDAVKDVMRRVAEENGGPDAFMAARRGQVPLGQIEALSEVSGLDPKQLQKNIQGVGRLMQNDEVVRAYVNGFKQAAAETVAAAKQAALTGSDADALAYAKAELRTQMLQEQVAGLTAEAGRTLRTFQEFGGELKDAKSFGDFIKKAKGEGADTLEAVKERARNVSTMDPAQAAKHLADLNKPGMMDKVFFSVVNSWLWNPMTHIKYAGVNLGWLGFNALVVKPVAAAFNLARATLSDKEIERVYFGESAAAVAGLVSGLPRAFIVAGKAIRDNAQYTSAREAVASTMPLLGPKNPFESMAGRAYGEAVGASGRVITGIHSYFKFLGEQVSLAEQAYVRTVKEGGKPWEPDFWQRHLDNMSFPTDQEMDKAVADGYRGVFMQPLGGRARALASAISATPFRFILPFMHIPQDIFKAGIEGTPLALAETRRTGMEGTESVMRANLLGKNGERAQDLQWAKLVVGSSLIGFAVYNTLSDRQTGDGPTDPKAFAEWRLTHRPNSIRIGDQWFEMSRLGPIGDWMNMGANLAEMAPYLKEGDYEKAASLIVRAGGKWIEDGVGMLGVSNLFDAIHQPTSKGANFAGNFASGALPFSGLTRSAAAFLDPSMREAKGFLDSLRMGIPGAAWGVGRESLPVKRDWLGTPIDNPAETAVIRTEPVSNDPLALEMQHLDINPTPIDRMIKGVKLDPQLYDEYQSLQGPLNLRLHQMVNQPGWQNLPDNLRKTVLEKTIHDMRYGSGGKFDPRNPDAEGIMQMRHPQVLIQGPVQAKVQRFTGAPAQ